MLERSFDGSNFSSYTKVRANVTSYWVGWQKRTAYFRVRAINGFGYSAPSNVVELVPPCLHKCSCPSGSPAQPDTIWVEDAIPQGGVPAGDETWNWAEDNPGAFSEAYSSLSNTISGAHQHYFYNATTTMTVNAGERLLAYIYLDPSNPPSEIMLQWFNGNWEHRAYWGANSIGLGADGTDGRRYMGTLPAAGEWVRLEVPASLVGLEGSTLNGMAFMLYGGRASWDYAGKTTQAAEGNPDAPSNLIALAQPGPHVDLSWTAPATAVDHYQVERSQNINAGYAVIASSVTGTTYSDTSVTNGVAYLYRVRANNASGGYSAYSNADLATTVTFTDNPLVSYSESLNSGRPATPIRAIHINQLRDTVNDVRALAGLNPATWTYSVNVGNDIHVEDITDLRARVGEAFAALGLPAPSYTDPTITRHVTPVSKAHVQELRDLVQ
ncbi:MAG: hypothetical protein ACJ74W_01235 [Pyrinomonadaceae bacterium]